MSHFVCRFRGGEVVRQVTEEVVAEDAGYASEQRGVDALALEDVVNVLAVAVELAGEPRHGALLPPEFCLDFAADVKHGGTPYII